MATLAGLEYMQIQEMKRHNLATEREQERSNRAQQALKRTELDNSLSMHASKLKSEEMRAASSLDNALTIAKIKDESDRYKTDMSVVAKNPIASTIAGIALSAERVGTGNWGSQSDSTPVKGALKQNLEPLNNVVSRVVKALPSFPGSKAFELGKKIANSLVGAN